MKALPVTLEQRVTDTGGRSSGFDYLRIILACAVVFWHAFTTSYGDGFAYSVMNTPLRAPIAVIVPMFFALSGWLVAGSLFRNALPTFIGLRVIRIVPALSVETLLSALILGPLLTTLPLNAYFHSPIFLKYLMNILGWIHIRLPGMFLTNPVPNIVNGQLWTVPWELWCYAALAAAALFRVIRSRLLFLILVIIGTAGLFVTEVIVHGQINQENGVAPQALLMAFLSAVCLYLYRDRLPWSGKWALGAMLLTLALLAIPGGDYLLGFPVAYITVYLGLLNPKKVGVLKSADYSYGLYIYHYAIQQALVFLMPNQREWYVIFPLSFVLSGVFAAFSWTFIEKPALGLRTYLPHVERVFARLKPNGKLATESA
jgi:peptidoglycan/LPS O-acetylase OafA/YrhL